MKNPFKRSASTHSYDPKNPALSADGWDPKPLREAAFDILKTRVGSKVARDMREDFDHHLAEDPVNGAEAAWACLCGKLVGIVDKFNAKFGAALIAPEHGDLAVDDSDDDEPISPFTTFRKDG